MTHTTVGYFPVFVLYLFLFLGAFTASALTVGFGSWFFWAGFLALFSAGAYWKAKDRPGESSGEAWEHSTITIDEVFAKNVED